MTTMFTNVAEFVGPALATVLALASARRRRSRSTRSRSSSARPSSCGSHRGTARPLGDAAAMPTRHRGRGGGVWTERADRLRRGPLARVGLGDARVAFWVALFFGVAPFVRASARSSPRDRYGKRRRLRDVCRRASARAGRRLAALAPLAAALSDAPGDDVVLLGRGDHPLRDRRPLAVVLRRSSSPAGGLAVRRWWVTALAERIPPDKLSRVTSYDWVVSLGLRPARLRARRAGRRRLGAIEVLLGGAAIAFVALGFGLLPRETRMLQRRDDPGAPFALPDPHTHAQVP